MLLRPQFKRCFRCEAISSEGVILLSERGRFLLRGTGYLRLAPLLDGQHTINEIIDCLRGQVSAAEVFYALDLLQQHGYVVDAAPSVPSEQAAFWELMGVDPQDAVRRLQETAISVISFGAIDSAPFQPMLASLGCRVSDDGKCWVVFTDDYLHDELDVLNREALARDRPWLLVKPVGTELWVGPLFLPGRTGCLSCLAHRLRGARKIEGYLQEKKAASTPFSAPIAVLPSTLQTAYGIAATEVAKWIVRGQNEEIEGRVVTLDTISLAKHSHQLVRRPQCPSCGDPTAFAAKQAEPLVLQSWKKTFTADGGRRTYPSEETVDKLKHHISPITGIVSFLQSNSAWADEESLTSSYIAGHNFVHISRDGALDLNFLCANLRSASGGKGKHPAQAKASALCEAVERFSGVFQGDESRFRAKFKELWAAAFHPNACMLFSEQQFKEREQWNADGSGSHWVPEPFNEDIEVEWSPVWSLTHNEPRYVPTAYCYYGYSGKYNTWFARADSNGCAAGHNKEEAILQGFMELVERDSVALWWYNRLRKPAVDLSSFAEPYFQELLAYYQALHRDLWVLDITSDLNIPTFAAISRRNDKEVEDIIFGFGAHFDPCVAILRALTEVNQSLPAVLSVMPGEDGTYLDPDPKATSWWKTTTLENQSYLVPDHVSAPKVQADYPQYWSNDLYTDVMTCVKIAREKGLETLVLDQTRPDTGLHVVKVFVPGLRHFWPRFAPGRLYNVPVQMGWLSEPLTESQLNPQHIYF
jgi:bacteriocin biosynthesis cyclodehydratase domain-containing protein